MAWQAVLTPWRRPAAGEIVRLFLQRVGLALTQSRLQAEQGLIPPFFRNIYLNDQLMAERLNRFTAEHAQNHIPLAVQTPMLTLLERADMAASRTRASTRPAGSFRFGCDAR